MKLKEGIIDKDFTDGSNLKRCRDKGFYQGVVL